MTIEPLTGGHGPSDSRTGLISQDVPVSLPDDRSIPIGRFPQKAQRFLDPNAPDRLKRMVAGGLVPMKPVVQLCALYQIAHREAGELATMAIQSVQRIPGTSLEQALTQPMLPVVLDWLADLFLADSTKLRPILLNRVTDDETVERVAKSADEATCDLIAQNQTRLVRHPAIVESLFFNANARASTIDRTIDFAARSGLLLPNIPNYEELAAEIGVSLPQSDEEAEAQDAAFRAAQVAMEDLVGADDRSLEDVASAAARTVQRASDFDDDGEEDEGKSKMSAAGRIRELNIAQKVRLALMGSATERGILIRDTNKVVARTVIRSPAVTDAEVLQYSKNKSLIDEVINYIASNKKWTRHYRLKLNLVMNPKCPTAEAMRFLNHLRLSDLRMVARSRDVPGPVAKAARNLVRTRSG